MINNVTNNAVKFIRSIQNHWRRCNKATMNFNNHHLKIVEFTSEVKRKPEIGNDSARASLANLGQQFKRVKIWDTEKEAESSGETLSFSFSEQSQIATTTHDITCSTKKDAVVDKEAQNPTAKASICNKAEGLKPRIDDASSLDLCFLLDCTGSMRSHIEAIKHNVCDMVSSIHAIHPDITLRLAFIGYRDYVDGCARLVEFKFGTANLDAFKAFVASQMASGGCSQTADVFGGLKAVGNLEWKASTRLLFHCGDAPCHGVEFHGNYDLDDPFPNGVPEDVPPKELLDVLKEKQIDYFFGRINTGTDCMIVAFNKIMGKNGIATIDAANAATMMAKVTDAVTSNLLASLSLSLPMAEENRQIEAVVDPVDPMWPSLRVESMRTFTLAPWTLQEGFDCDCGRLLRPLLERVDVKVAPFHFAIGSCQAAYFAQQQQQQQREQPLLDFQDSGATELETTLGHAAEKSGIIICSSSSSSSSSSTTSSTKGSSQSSLLSQCGELLFAAALDPEEVPLVHKLLLAQGGGGIPGPAQESSIISFADSRCTACSFAEGFSRVKPPGCPSIRFLPLTLIQYLDRPGMPFATQESCLKGNFVKFNNNTGLAIPNPTPDGVDHSTVQAFSHWTHFISGRRMLVVDCQGVFDAAEGQFVLTDPAIHSLNDEPKQSQKSQQQQKQQQRFGVTNLGELGMEQFFKTHRCNSVCKALGLQAFK